MSTSASESSHDCNAALAACHDSSLPVSCARRTNFVMPAPITATRRPVTRASSYSNSASTLPSGSLNSTKRGPESFAAALVSDHHAALDELHLGRVQVGDGERERATGTDRARAGAVQPDLDGSRAELRPLLAGAIAQLELQHVAVERDRTIHVAHEEVDEVRVARASSRTPAARRLPPTSSARPATTARRRSGRRLRGAARRRRGTARGRSPRGGDPRRARLPTGSPVAGSSPCRPSASRCCSCLYANVSSTSARSTSSGATSAWRYAISPARRAATASPQCRLSRLGASWLHPTPSTQTDAWRPRSSAASTVTTQPSVLSRRLLARQRIEQRRWGRRRPRTRLEGSSPRARGSGVATSAHSSAVRPLSCR